MKEKGTGVKEKGTGIFSGLKPSLFCPPKNMPVPFFHSDGYDYYSKNGYGAGNYTHTPYATLEDFLKSPEAQRYNRYDHIKTTTSQDKTMKANNNCADLIRKTLKKGGIDDHYQGPSITRPNSLYNSLRHLQ